MALKPSEAGAGAEVAAAASEEAAAAAAATTTAAADATPSQPPHHHHHRHHIIKYRDDILGFTRGLYAVSDSVVECHRSMEDGRVVNENNEVGEVPCGTVVGGKVRYHKISLRAVIDLIRIDDPLHTLCPAEKLLLKGFGDILKCTPARLQDTHLVFPARGGINIYCERDWRHLYYRHITVPQPVILEVSPQHATALSIGLPNTCADSRPRHTNDDTNAPPESPQVERLRGGGRGGGGAGVGGGGGGGGGGGFRGAASAARGESPDTASFSSASEFAGGGGYASSTGGVSATTAAVGLRYYDDASDSYVRVPHGGSVPLPGAGGGAAGGAAVRVCIEMSPYLKTESVAFGAPPSASSGEPFSTDGFNSAAWAAGGGGSDSAVSEPHVDISAPRLLHENSFLEHLYDESELSPTGKGTGNAKKVARKGIPTSRKQAFYQRMLCQPPRSRWRPDQYDFNTIFNDTFKMSYKEVQENWPSFTPLAPLFGVEGGLNERYHQLRKNELRAISIVLAMVAQKHPLVRFFPILPRLLCFLVKYLSLRNLHSAAVTLVCATVGEDSDAFVRSASSSASDMTGMPAVGGDAETAQLKYYPNAPSDALESLILTLIRGKLSGVHSRYMHTTVNLGALGLHWMNNLFVTALPRYLCERVIDMYILEGVKVLYRIVLAMVKEIQGVPMKSIPYDAGLRDEEKLFTEAFSLSLKKKELILKAKQGGTRGAGSGVDTDLIQVGNTVTARPALPTRSAVLDDPQYLETIYSWIVSGQLGGRLEKIFDKENEGKTLTSLAARCEPGGPGRGPRSACLVVVKAVPRQRDPRLSLSSAAAAGEGGAGSEGSEEIFGYFLSDPLVPAQGVIGNGTSFGFKLLPYPVRVAAALDTNHCRFSSSLLSFGINKGVPWLEFGDTDCGVSSSVRLSHDGSSSPEGGAAVETTPVCGGKFHVLDFEVFSFETASPV